MKNTILFLVLIIQASILYGQDKEKNVKGIVIQEKSFNKAGKELPGDGDFYLKIRSKKYFIKFDYGSTIVNDLKAILNEKRKFKVSFHNGLWDTDDPNVQSRIGDYVTIVRIMKRL